MNELEMLTPLKPKIAKPVKKIVFDVETTEWITPYALGIYDGEECQILEGRDCITKFLHLFLSFKYRNYVAYAHNGGKFDFNFILDEIRKNKEFNKYKCHPIRAGSRVIQLRIDDNRRNVWILRDSYSLLSNSLRDLTNNFEVENLKGEIDHSKIKMDNYKQYRDEWLPYLKDDCKGLYQVLTKYENYLIRSFNVSLRRNITTAQLAMNIFRQTYLKMNLPNYRSREANIRKAYYGGRCEIVKTKAENVHYYDVNSLYPYVMRNFEMPVGSPLKSYDMKTSDYGIAYCEITTPKNMHLPVLPHRHNGKLIFSSGKWKGWYCTPELQLAEAEGYKIKVLEGYKFDKAILFDKYIDDLYKIKQTAKRNGVAYMNAKLLMNSLYGKFGQRREMTQNELSKVSPMGDEIEGKMFWVKTEKISKANHILPAIAAFVTSYARIHLYHKIKNADPIYYDTDSVITPHVLPTSDELGDLKDEMPEGIQEAIFLRPKMYSIKTAKKTETKCKGFTKNIFTHEQFQEAQKTGVMTSFQESKTKFSTPFESMRRKGTYVSMIDIKKTVIGKYDKRVILEDGINTKPHEIYDD